MKGKIIIGILVIGIITGCQTTGSLVNSNFNYKGEFDSYQKFDFVNLNQNGLDQYESAVVRSIISKRFNAQGYQHETESPDLLIIYKVVENEMIMNGFGQSRLTSWSAFKNPGSLEIPNSGNRKKTKLPPGSLLIYLIDAKAGEVVWMGYSGLFDLEIHERTLISSVGLILDNYKLTRFN